MNGGLTYLLLILSSVLFSILNILLINYFSEDEKMSVWMKGMIALLTTVCMYAAWYHSTQPVTDVIFGMLLIVTGGIDHLTKTVVVGLTVFLGLLAAASTAIYQIPTIDMLWGGLFGFAFYLIIYLVAKAYYKKEAFGYGDVIFMGVIGLTLGFQDTALASLLTFYVALIFIAVFSIIGKLTSRKAEIAFAPYMAIAAWMVSYFGSAILKLYVNLFL